MASHGMSYENLTYLVLCGLDFNESMMHSYLHPSLNLFQLAVLRLEPCILLL